MKKRTRKLVDDKYKDERYGQEKDFLTILERHDQLDNRGYRVKSYDCRCVCGNIINVTTTNLKKIKSCGCIYFHDYTGKRFCRLLVLFKNEYLTEEKGRTVWHCICDCGNECDVDDSNLTRGSTKSCGCYQREGASNRLKKYNDYDLSNEYGIGFTNNVDEDGRNYFYFDLEDYDRIKDYCWGFNKEGYLCAKSLNKDGKHILLHRFVLDVSDSKQQIDHIHHLKFDNRKSELRIVTNSQNQMNKDLQKNNRSGTAGITWHKRDQIWEVHISKNNEQIYLGRFENLNDAIEVRKRAEKEYFGEYSYDQSQAI